MNVHVLLIIFFLFLIIHHLLTTIVFPNVEKVVEGMKCNVNKRAKQSECFKKRMSENQSMIVTVETNIEDLMKKVTNIVSKVNSNTKKIKSTKGSIINIKNAEEGRAVDNKEACKKHPDAC